MYFTVEINKDFFINLLIYPTLKLAEFLQNNNLTDIHFIFTPLENYFLIQEKCSIISMAGI